MIFEAQHKYFGNREDGIDYWVIVGMPTQNDFPMTISTRIGIACYLNIPAKDLTIYLRDEYNYTSLYQSNKFYTFTTRADCEMACKYLDTLLVVKKLRGI